MTGRSSYRSLPNCVGDGRPELGDRSWQALVWLRRRRVAVRAVPGAVLLKGARVRACHFQKAARRLGWPG